MITVSQLTIENQETLLGMDIPRPRFSWQLQGESKGLLQEAYQIRVFLQEVGSAAHQRLIWDTEKVASQKSIHVEYQGPPLESRVAYSWQVRVWCSNGEVSDWSQASYWEMGLLKVKDWVAKWIEPNQLPVTEEKELTLEDMFINKKKSVQPLPEERLHASKLLRKLFCIEQKEIQRARLYITAHGLYRATLNGERMSDAEFTPDFTSYSKYLQYQTYDVTPYLIGGENVLGVILADGWYAGRISVPGGSAQFGDRLGLLAQLEIIYADQTKQIIGTDDSFFSRDSHFVYSDIFIGEKQDRTQEKKGWDQPGYKGSYKEGEPVQISNFSLDHLHAQYGEAVRPVETLSPIHIWKEESDSNAYLIDFGQVLVGRVRLKVKGKYGQPLKLEHSEVLNENGEFFNNIMGRNKDQIDLESPLTFH